MKNLFESFKENFPLILGCMLTVSILDLIGLGGSADIGLGFILSFVLFFGYLIKKML